jgi:hypothetical protein
VRDRLADAYRTVYLAGVDGYIVHGDHCLICHEMQQRIC